VVIYPHCPASDSQQERQALLNLPIIMLLSFVHRACCICVPLSHDTHTRTHTILRAYTHTYTHPHSHSKQSAHTHTHMRTHMPTDKHTRTHTHTRAHTHAHTYTVRKAQQERQARGRPWRHPFLWSSPALTSKGRRCVRALDVCLCAIFPMESNRFNKHGRSASARILCVYVHHLPPFSMLSRFCCKAHRFLRTGLSVRVCQYKRTSQFATDKF